MEQPPWRLGTRPMGRRGPEGSVPETCGWDWKYGPGMVSYVFSATGHKKWPHFLKFVNRQPLKKGQKPLPRDRSCGSVIETAEEREAYGQDEAPGENKTTASASLVVLD